MSEGTPGRGPDADSRTGTGDGQASTNGRPAVPPVRYGPRNGQPGGPRGSAGSRPVSAPNAPQQYRGPQAPRVPTTDAAGTSPSGSNGTGTNGAGSNGSNGSGANGPRTPPPASYTRPRSNGAPTRPQPSELERSVTEARTAAAARNASAAKVRGGSALGGNRPTAAATADDTAVIAAVTPDQRKDTARTEPMRPDAAATEQRAPDATPEKGRSRFGRLRDLRPASTAGATATVPAAQHAQDVTEAAAASKTAQKTEDKAPSATEGKTETRPTVAASVPESRTEPDAGEPTPETVTSERPLTWRDRLGLPPKEPKPQPVVVPVPGPGVPTAAAAPAVAASVAAGAAPPETKASPSGPTTAPQLAPVQGPVTPSSPTAGTSDTVVIPAVDAGSVAPAAPAAAATAQPLVTARPKVGAARRTRKARLRLSRVDPWSVMKTALLFSIAAGIILVVATYGVWSVLNASGLFDAVNDMVKSVVSTPGDTTPFRIEEYVNTQKIIGVAALIAVVDVLIFTALATLGSFLYNLAATVLGGLEVTLAED